MSPIGPYDSFDDCVAKNQDKESPEGFCAFLEHKISGQWPGATKAKLPDDLFKIYEEALVANKSEKDAWEAVQNAAFKGGYDMARFGWVKVFQAPKMKTITGVKVFAAGTWTDSSGATREWGEKDLDRMVEAFKAKVPKIVPLKCGHTSDAFNKKVAEALGVPLELITGDKGQGQVGLGRMSALDRVGNLLEAAFENCPDAIAALIEGGLYSTVSVEVEDKIGDFGPCITGVALLGAEEPAVDKASLEGASVFGGKREGARVLSFQASKKNLEGVPVEVLDQEFKAIKGDLDQAIGKAKGASFFKKLFEPIGQWFESAVNRKPEAAVLADYPWDQCIADQMDRYGDEEIAKKVCGAIRAGHAKESKSKLSEILSAIEAEFKISPKKKEQKGEIMDLKKLCAALGLPDTASEADVMAAIEALKGQAAPPAGMAAADFAKEKPTFAAVLKENKDLKDAKTKADHDTRFASYLALTKEFKAVPGTAEELATSLTDMEEKSGKPTADTALAAFNKAETLAKEAGILKPKGSSKDGKAGNDFNAAVEKYSKDNPTVARVDAIKAVSAANPALWADRNK